MRTRRLRACVFGLLVAAPASAREPSAPPTELPLLPVPSMPDLPTRPGPRGPSGEYDPGYLYLPERAPDVAKLPPCPCRPLGRWWVSPTLELGWTEGARLPPLVRVGTGGPVVYGGRQLPAQFREGLGLTAGAWLDHCQTRGIDASFYYLSPAGHAAEIVSAGAPLMLPTAQGFFPLTDPDAGFIGAFQTGLTTHYLTADVNYRHTLYCETDGRLDALVGYRYAHLGDQLDLYGKRVGPGGEIVRFRDQVDAANDFHGGQVGLAGEYRMGDWYLGGSGTVAFGSVFTRTDLSGKFRVNGVVVPYGFYARPDVAGVREESRFAVMPVLRLTLGRQLTEHARVFVGYQFQYLNNLTRAGDVIDPTPSVPAADPLLVQPSPLPRRDATASDFWAQSVNLGFELRY